MAQKLINRFLRHDVIFEYLRYIDISVKTITRILKNVQIRSQAISKKVIISKIKRLEDRKNPASNRNNQKKTTLIFFIKSSSGFIKRYEKKIECHYLTERNKKKH